MSPINRWNDGKISGSSIAERAFSSTVPVRVEERPRWHASSCAFALKATLADYLPTYAAQQVKMPSDCCARDSCSVSSVKVRELVRESQWPHACQRESGLRCLSLRSGALSPFFDHLDVPWNIVTGCCRPRVREKRLWRLRF
jgi:hypothetical protein